MYGEMVVGYCAGRLSGLRLWGHSELEGSAVEERKPEPEEGRQERSELQAGDRTELPETAGGVLLYRRPFIRAKLGGDEF